MARDDQPPDFVRLSPAVLAPLKRSSVASRKGFVSHFHASEAVGDPYRGFAALRDGRAAPRPVGEALVDYLVKIKVLADPAGALEPAAPRRADDGFWNTLASATDAMFTSLREREEGVVEDAGEELPAIAEAVAAYVGRMNAPDSTGLTEVQRGEAVMGRTVAAYARWLALIHAAEPRAVKFAVTPEGRRVAASVCFATTPAACEGVCAGRLSDGEVTPADLVSWGKHLFVAALVPFGDPRRVSVAARERAEIHAVFYQAAYFTRGLRPYRPVVYTFAGNRLTGERLRRHGYSPTGSCLRGTDKAVMAIRHPRDGGRDGLSPRQRLAYSQLRVALRAYQWVNLGRWRDEDRGRRPRDG